MRVKMKQTAKLPQRLIRTILLSLLPMSATFAAAAPPPVFMGHFYVALDEASFDALRKSSEVGALAHVVESHTVAGKDEWTGFYVQGRQTYLEFFGAQNLPEGMRLGDTGLGLTVERAGGVSEIAARLGTVFGKRVEITTTPRTTPTGTIPWFTSTQIKSDAPESMETWFMETDPAYLATVHPGAKIENPFSREQSLSWYFLPDHELDNITGITAALKPAEIAQLATELKLIGWSVRTHGKGFVANGPDLKLKVLPAGPRAGIQQVDLRLRRSVAKQNIPLGNIELLLDGNTGQLVFWK
jgi:Family of unknown function (DUF5829)